MDTLYAYLAGIIDGEGTITLQKEYAGCIPTVAIANSCVPLLEKCGEIVPWRHMLYRKKKYQAHHRDPWVLIWRWDAAIAVAALTLPWLIAKREQAELLQQWKSVVRRNGRYKPAELAARDELIARIRVLNGRPTKSQEEMATGK